MEHWTIIFSHFPFGLAVWNTYKRLLDCFGIIVIIYQWTKAYKSSFSLFNIDSNTDTHVNEMNVCFEFRQYLPIFRISLAFFSLALHLYRMRKRQRIIDTSVITKYRIAHISEQFICVVYACMHVIWHNRPIDCIIRTVKMHSRWHFEFECSLFYMKLIYFTHIISTLTVVCFALRYTWIINISFLYNFSAIQQIGRKLNH